MLFAVRNVRQFGWIPVQRHKALGCMELLLEHLKVDFEAYGSHTHEVAASVRGANNDKKLKIVKKSVKSGKFQETVEEREPRDDEKEVKDHKKAKSNSSESSAHVAVVRPPAASHSSDEETPTPRAI